MVITRVELTEAERDALLGVLKDRLGTMREQVYHSDTTTFREELKAEAAMLQVLIAKLSI